MGLLRDLTGTAAWTVADAGPLRDLVSAVVTADGSVDVAEHATVEALFESIPQLRAAPSESRPPVTGEKALLARLAAVTDDKLRRQLFVLAVDLALASEGAHDREDALVTSLQTALKIDAEFATQTITVLAHKYARAR